MTDFPPPDDTALTELRRRAESELEAAEAYHRAVQQSRAAWEHALRYRTGKPDDPYAVPGWTREDLVEKISQSEPELEWATANLARVRTLKPRLRLL